MLFDSTLFSSIAAALNPFKILGIIRNALNPTLGVVDGLLGYEDFELLYDGKPSHRDLQPKKLYFYKENDKLYCMRKEFPYAWELNEAYLDKTILKEFTEIFNEPEAKRDLSIKAKSDLYNFLVDNKLTVGLKASWHQNIVKNYNEFETKFKKNHPNIVQAYLFCKHSINNICTFAVSQTGLRVAGLASAIAVSLASGGIVPAILTGAYAASIGIAVAQQAYSKMRLNSLTEEADLLVRYEKNNNILKASGINIVHKKKPHVLETPVGQAKRWLAATAKHLATYFCEAAVPVASAILCPISGVVSAVQFGVFIGVAAVGVGTGAYARKVHEDNKNALKEQIAKVKIKDEIPDYNNVTDLKRLLVAQEKDLQTRGFLPKQDTIDSALQVQSGLQQYWQGLKDVINPFKDSMAVKDSKVFAKIVASSSLPLVAIAAGTSGNPYLLIPGLATAAIAGAAATTMHSINSKTETISASSKNDASTTNVKQPSLEVARTQAKEAALFNEVKAHKSFAGALLREKVVDNPLGRYK